jgi:hypothetical protein
MGDIYSNWSGRLHKESDLMAANGDFHYTDILPPVSPNIKDLIHVPTETLIEELVRRTRAMSQGVCSGCGEIKAAYCVECYED